MISSRRLDLSVHRLDFLSCLEKRLLCDVLDSPEDLNKLSLNSLSVIIGRRLRVQNWQPQRIIAEAEEDLRYCDKRGIRVLHWEDDRYPELLREIYDPPFLLFIRASSDDCIARLLGSPEKIALVGTRKPSRAGREAAFRMGRDLAYCGASVISGLALGIDGEGHEGALSMGGKTIAVLGSGIDTIYPRSHRDLAARIISSGSIVLSEYPPGIRPLKYHFPARNRIISGLSKATVVVEAPQGSGALITSDFALEEGREVYIHSAALYEGSGAAALADSGAAVISSAFELYGKTELTPSIVQEEANEDLPDLGGERTGLELAAMLEAELQKR